MTEKTVAVNYTEAQTAELVSTYQANPTAETVEALATKLGKSVKSVVAKLSREGVYQKSTKATKAKARTKADLVAQLEANYNTEPGALQTLEKASKEALELLVQGFEQE